MTSVNQNYDLDEKYILESAIVHLYHLQTADERVLGTASLNNGIGFNKFDAKLLSDFAIQINSGKNLSLKQCEVAKKRMEKYKKQLENTGFVPRSKVDVGRKISDKYIEDQIDQATEALLRPGSWSVESLPVYLRERGVDKDWDVPSLAREFNASEDHVREVLEMVREEERYVAVEDEGLVFDIKSGLYRRKEVSGRPVDQALFKWERGDLLVNRVVKHQENTFIEYRYCGFYQGKEFEDISGDEIYEGIRRKCRCFNRTLSKDNFPGMLGLWTRENQIPQASAEIVMGFTELGWKMPNEYVVSARSGFKQLARDNIKRIFSESYDPYEAIDQFQQFYHALSIEHKDFLIAWALYAPFGYALRETFRLMVPLLLGGLNQTGKTPAGKKITMGFWGHFDMIFNDDNIESSSRLTDILSTSTLPILFDECENLDAKKTSTLKSSLTEKNVDFKKRQDQTLDKQDPICALYVASFNNLSIGMSDVNYLSRCFHLHVDHQFTDEEITAWDAMAMDFVPGLIGRHIYECTKDWTLETLLSRLSEVPDPLSLEESRDRTKFKFFMLGKMLASEFFDIDLQLEHLEELILLSTQSSQDELFSLIEDQIEEGKPKLTTWDDEKHVTHERWDFAPKIKWVTVEILPKTYKGILGILYTADNLKDLENRIGDRSKMTLPKLYQILRTRWNVEEPTSLSDKNWDRDRYGIFIPDISYRTPRN